MDQRSDEIDSNFDALIDLLTSDDVQNTPHSNGHTARLRDASGKLDFDKIHFMFAKRNLGAGSADDKEQSRRLAPQREADPQDVGVFFISWEVISDGYSTGTRQRWSVQVCVSVKPTL